MIEIIRLKNLKDTKKIQGKLTIAIGNFDGLHEGHQKLIRRVCSIAKETDSIPSVLTFDPHPVEILRENISHFYLNTFNEKCKALEDLGVEKIFSLKFSKKIMSQTPKEFIEIFLENLPIKALIVGENFKFGKMQKGSVIDLENFCSRNNIVFESFKLVKENEKKISSSNLREFIEKGKVENFKKLRGKHYVMKGVVMKGKKIGRKLGFPTANLTVNKKKLLPKTGVYKVNVLVNNICYEGVANIGLRPTVDKNRKTPICEVHILNFKGEIYDEEITIEFLYFIRDEKKFNNLEELKEQIRKDIEISKKTNV